jgi:membrane protein
MPRRRRSPTRRRRRHLAHELSRRFSEHELPIYASAIAFRALVALIPLALLGLGLLGALGLKDTWRKSIAPAIKPRVIPEVYSGINATAEKVLSSGTAGVIVFATALVIWDTTIGISAAMSALNRVHEVQEKRPLRRRAVVAVGLAVATALCLIGAALLLLAGPQAGGTLDVVLGILRWLLALLLLMLAVGLLVRFGPAEKPGARWASAGSLLVVGTWVIATLLFKLWVTHVANFKTAVGSLTGLLLLTLYLFVSSAIFIVGVELDELLRKEPGVPR